MLIRRREEEQTQRVMGKTEMQGAERKRMLFDRPKSRHEYLEGKCTA